MGPHARSLTARLIGQMREVARGEREFGVKATRVTMRARWRSRALRHAASSVLVTILVLSPPTPFAAPIRITCVDGGGDLLEGGGRSLLSAGFCDADHSADGFCTFAFDPLCPSCLLGTRACSPDAHVESCPGLGPIPCPSPLPHYVLPAPRRLFQQKHRRIHVRVGRFRASFILRCRRGLGSSAAVQPLSGDWTLTETGAGGDCPPDIASAVKTPTVMRIAQTGSLLSACLNVDGSVDWSSAAAAQGIVSEYGMLLTAGNCCYADVPRRAVETYSLTFSSMSSPSGDTIQTSEESQVQAADPLVGGLTCTKTAEVTITRVLTAVACNADTDCLNTDHCGRCMQGRCSRSPLCQ